MLALYRLVFLMKKAMNNYSYLSRIRCINCSPIIASVFFINSLAFSANGSSINSRLSCRHLLQECHLQHNNFVICVLGLFGLVEFLFQKLSLPSVSLWFSCCANSFSLFSPPKSSPLISVILIFFVLLY